MELGSPYETSVHAQPAKIVRHGNNTSKASKPFFGSTSVLSALK
jgi:hypothetical protein